jgi:hypothetical protein
MFSVDYSKAILPKNFPKNPMSLFWYQLLHLDLPWHLCIRASDHTFRWKHDQVYNKSSYE